MGGVGHRARMNKTVDVETLIREIQRYLAVVNAFRALGRKPGRARRKENRE